MADGWIFDQYGKFRLSKALDTEWQERVLKLFWAVHDFLAERFGQDVFFVYGTLLGAVRENGFIGHDVDLDAAYLSSKRSGRAAAHELRDIAMALIDAGYVVDAYRAHLHITDTEGALIDLFHLYFDKDRLLAAPFGVAGTSEIRRSEWRGVKEIDFLGGKAVVPVIARKVVAHLYGEDWRHPRPGFHWPDDRVNRAVEGLLPERMRSEIYWANFYAHASFDSGSTFQSAVNARADMPSTVIDIGCGDGRDSFAFCMAGRTVLGIDRSHIGIDHALRRAEKLGNGATVGFATVDVADAACLRETLRDALARTPEAPVLFYMRFFLHAIAEDVQDALLSVLSALARPGDMLAAEFRTDKDEELTKVFADHYRRYQNGSIFGQALQQRYGFTILEVAEGRGLSPYGDEDPELYRVVARK